ncbi:glycoside hydrolase family 5 protein [Jaapia argillacea MUCL 33604]|uniref:mannan endo-1,4-beta-mannosidase n=1 Tax=Jaapia argillacea MUCL 33604 TaxID=933084 RepID=A0A067PSL2_9AGAM|nr:glycoside hydrolase family 5 protein [Jaapia argillacea MUCL 33604]
MFTTLPILFLLALGLLHRAAGTGVDSGFVTTSQGQFFLDSRTFRHYGTNAYWLNMVTDEDLDFTFLSIAGAGYTVVRTWAFNDVSQKPASGTYFQILQGGTATINDGPDGLQRLDKVVATANKYGLKLVLTLTNNWNPQHAQSSSSIARLRRDNSALPRGFLSNDYGGMDLYVSNFHPGGTHDLFYTDSTIITAFKKYTATIVNRYLNDSTILGWELANDPRCSSTVPASSSCNTKTITKWVALMSSYIKSLDSCHLVTAGDSGFYCLGCPKIYAPSSVLPQASSLRTGPAFDGSYGVDTQDIISVPTIDFGSFQFFPDQVQTYASKTPNFAIDSLGHGITWVSDHSDTGGSVGKPETLTAYGIVTKQSWDNFVPVNGTAPTSGGLSTGSGGVEVFQRDFGTISWSSIGLNGNIGGILEYQWAGNELTGTSSKRQTAHPPPNDGYANYAGPNSQAVANLMGTSNTPS